MLVFVMERHQGELSTQIRALELLKKDKSGAKRMEQGL